MIFDGHDLSEWVRTKHTMRLLAKIDDTTTTVPGRDGAILMRSQLKPLVIPAVIRLKSAPCTSEDTAVLWREIAATLATDTARPLILPEEPDLHYLAKLTDAGDLDTLWYTGSCKIEFTAYDPIAYGKRRSATVSAGLSEVRVGGTYKTYPVFSLKASSTTRVRITNEDTGDYILMSASPSKDIAVEVDMEDETLRMNTNLQKVDIGSDYFPLVPGLNRIRIVGASGTATWTERWL